MRSKNVRSTVVVWAAIASAWTINAFGQTPPWHSFFDPVTGEICDLVNSEELELVVLDSELVVVTGPDEVIPSSFVDDQGVVFFGIVPVGVIEFATDGDGRARLWLLTELGGTVLRIAPDTFVPSDSGIFPEEFVRVLCDACPFWDFPEDCDDDLDDDGVPNDDDFCPETPFGADVDPDGCACFQIEIDFDADGVGDCDDLCPDTPGDETADFDGCSCSQLIDCFCALDSDNDSVSDCDDQCPNTPFNTDVDLDGCSVVVVVQPPPIFISCGNFGTMTLAMTFCGLASLRFMDRRPRRV